MEAAQFAMRFQPEAQRFYQRKLVVCQILIDGYTCLSLTRASATVKRQLMVAFTSLRSASQFLTSSWTTAEAAIETLAMQNTQLCFRHVQPTAVFGRGVDLQPPRQAARLRGAKRLIEGRNRMRVQVVLHQPHTQGLRVDLLQEHADTSGPVHLGAPVADEDLAPPT